MIKKSSRIIFEEHLMVSLDDLKDSPLKISVLFLLSSYIIHMSNFYISTIIFCTMIFVIHIIEDKITDRHVELIKSGDYPLIVSNELLDKSLSLVFNYDKILYMLKHDPEQLKEYNENDLKDKLQFTRESYLIAYRTIWMYNNFNGRYIPKCVNNKNTFGEFISQLNQK